jgi:hypothetical protein
VIPARHRHRALATATHRRELGHQLLGDQLMGDGRMSLPAHRILPWIGCAATASSKLATCTLSGIHFEQCCSNCSRR